MIPQRNLSLLSNRLARTGGRRIPEAVLERDYCLAWFLVGLSRSAVREQLVFKGGTALKHCYFGNYRFSEDLDFTLTEASTLDAILAGLEEVYDKVRRASGVIFRHARADRKPHQNNHTFYLAYEGPLPASSINPLPSPGPTTTPAPLSCTIWAARFSEGTARRRSRLEHIHVKTFADHHQPCIRNICQAPAQLHLEWMPGMVIDQNPHVSPSSTDFTDDHRLC